MPDQRRPVSEAQEQAPGPEQAPAPMWLTVSEAILEAAEQNSGVSAPPDATEADSEPRLPAEDGPGSPASRTDADSAAQPPAPATRSCAAGKPPSRAAGPISRDGRARPAGDRNGAGRRAGEEARSHG
ncbi:hypothetical protein GCM10027258_10750 [Amycolatopsis stemonae]